ncbi:cytochrome c oxidase subunit 6A, mitochondrial-like [Amphiura filiformis]|uniref:cytochrome c oxidase subunit 6A, mitochondrial-like n=1 Tax=Amphiura filiformis TaxID=82378 RepID=UPI003B2277E3
MASILRVVARRYSTANKQFLHRALSDTSHSAHHGEGDVWKKMFLFLAIPVMGFCTYNGFFSEEANAEHHREEFVPYSHLRIRVRRFPWSDGNHSLFHSHYNALPEGFEDEEH